MKRKRPTATRTTRIKRERDPIPWKYCVLTLVCGLILVGGFFFAARLHFTAIEYGIENSKLRKELEQLKTDNRIAILRREAALSAVNKVAQKIGFRSRTVNNLEVVGSPAQKLPVVLAVSDDQPQVKAFTNSDTLAKAIHVKFEEIEKKVTQPATRKPEPGVRKSSSDRTGKKTVSRDPVINAKKK